jgi:uncharacterized protein (TIGR03067 family)
MFSLSLFGAAACGDDGGGGADASAADASSSDAASGDAASADAASADAAEPDAGGAPDASESDGGAVTPSPLLGSFLVTAIDGEPPTQGTLVFTFEQSTWVIEANGVPSEGTYTFDDTTDPKELDLTLDSAVIVGIFRFSGDNNTLTFKAAEVVNGPRPTNFEIEENFDVVDMVRQQ